MVCERFAYFWLIIQFSVVFWGLDLRMQAIFFATYPYILCGKKTALKFTQMVLGSGSNGENFGRNCIWGKSQTIFFSAIEKMNVWMNATMNWQYCSYLFPCQRQNGFFCCFQASFSVMKRRIFNEGRQQKTDNLLARK